jgi:undecaprenyl diphosphate synthase
MGLKEKVMAQDVPKHIAIILDGNGRWAKKYIMPRTYGHKKGAENLRKIALFANEIGVKALSVYAFSTENWSRPKDEIDYLMDLPAMFENEYKGAFKEKDIRVIFSGRRDRFPKEVQELIERVEEKSKDRENMVLNICFDYGSKYEIAKAVKNIVGEVQNEQMMVDDINESTIDQFLYTKELPKLDLLIRTSGEQRLSNFMLIQSAYAEFYFTETYWPVFHKKDLLKAIQDYQKRNRRYGGLKKS